MDSIIKFLLDIVPLEWKNRLTKEFTITIKDNKRETKGSEILLWSFIFEINSKNSEEIQIKTIYIKLPHKVAGNKPQNPSLGELMVGDLGKYHIIGSPIILKHSLSNKFELTDRKILALITKRKLKKIVFVAVTNKYGNTLSNSIRVEKSFLRRIGAFPALR
jgi:hypothetical protein